MCVLRAQVHEARGGSMHCLWPSASLKLPTTVQLHILSLLHPNDRALAGRLTCRDAADAFHTAPHCTVLLSQPLPPHAVPWAVSAWQQPAYRLCFWHKLQMLRTATASGSEVNLEVVWALLQPSIFPELLQRRSSLVPLNMDPGVAAVRAGHLQLLGWLLRRCPALVDPGDLVRNAAEHCDLAGLQEVLGVLEACPSGPLPLPAETYQMALDWAAGSETPDAVAKLEWLLEVWEGKCSLQEDTAQEAAFKGSLGTLRWLRERGCPMGGAVLGAAIGDADLAVAQWLVDEAGCGLPEAGGEERVGRDWYFTSGCRGGVEKLRWLQERGAPLLGVSSRELASLAGTAAVNASVEVLRYLMSLFGTSEVLQADAKYLGEMATRSGSIVLVEFLRQAGLEFATNAYEGATGVGDVAMIRWLAVEVGVSAAGLWVDDRVKYWRRGGMLEAVQLLLGAGARIRDPERMLCDAAARGNLPLLQYLRDQQQHRGRLLSKQVFTNAAESGCGPLIEWLAEQPGCMIGEVGGCEAYLAACREGDRATLELLRRIGVPWGAEDVVARAVGAGCGLPVARWLVHQGAPVGDRMAVGVALLRAKDYWGTWDEEMDVWLRGQVGAAPEGLRGGGKV